MGRSPTTACAWRAVAALEGGVADEGLLDRVRPAGSGEAFDSEDFPARDVPDGRRAGAHGFVVHEDRAGAAVPLAAAVLGAAEAQVVAEHPEEGTFGVDGQARGLPVQRE